jgi:hypothetical protein
MFYWLHEQFILARKTRTLTATFMFITTKPRLGLDNTAAAAALIDIEIL